MTSEVMFVLAAVAVVTGIAAMVIPFSGWKDYFTNTREGRGALKGIVLALLFGIVLAFSAKLFAEERSWYVPEPGWEVLHEGSVFLGMDHTKNASPMCSGAGVDDRWTSNLGLRVGVFETPDKKFNVASKYTHHSCAYGVDSSSYDALGIELEYKLWGD